MESHNGTDYTQNYDVIVKWMAEVLRGETLEVLGVQTGRIEEVFGFEPVDIAVKAGRVDVMARDEKGVIYHLEEQRNLRKADMYRFASYHFQAARHWGAEVVDVILASGDVAISDTTITTRSGQYTPIIVDFTQKDGRKRLAEIQAAIEAGTFTAWIELIFLPLYGKESGSERSKIVEAVLRYESQLYHANHISARLLAAAFILSNKLIDKSVLRQIWENIKMLDILEIAKEEGIKEGKTLGLQEGKTLGLQEGKTLGLQEGMQELILETLIERFGLPSARLLQHIRGIHNQDVLKAVFHHTLKCDSLQELETLLNQVV